MFKNFHSSLNSLENQYSVHNSLLHLHSNFQDAITSQNIAYSDKRTLMHILFAMNVRNNYVIRWKFGENRSSRSWDNLSEMFMEETTGVHIWQY